MTLDVIVSVLHVELTNTKMHVNCCWHVNLITEEKGCVLKDTKSINTFFVI